MLLLKKTIGLGKNQLNLLLWWCDVQSSKSNVFVFCRKSYASEHNVQNLLCNFVNYVIIINPILVRVYLHKRGWADLPHSNSNLSDSHSPSCTIRILLLQTNTLALLLHLRLPRLLWWSSLPLAFTSNSNAFLKTCPSSLLNTCPYHLTPFRLCHACH